jgi:hypothetical protein
VIHYILLLYYTAHTNFTKTFLSHFIFVFLIGPAMVLSEPERRCPAQAELKWVHVLESERDARLTTDFLDSNLCLMKLAYA